MTNCTWPAPVVGGWETKTRLVDVMFRALLEALPERLPAGTKAMICHAGFGGVDAATGEYGCFLETFAGGYGGRFASDGPDAVQTHGQNTENAPVEETELNYPVRVDRLSLSRTPAGRAASAAASGCARTSLRPADDLHRARRPHAQRAVGRFDGGLEGARAEYVLVRDGESRRLLGAKTTLDVVPGDVISYRTCGGGGYGPPADRDPARVERTCARAR